MCIRDRPQAASFLVSALVCAKSHESITTAFGMFMYSAQSSNGM